MRSMQESCRLDDFKLFREPSIGSIPHLFAMEFTIIRRPRGEPEELLRGRLAPPPLSHDRRGIEEIANLQAWHTISLIRS